MNSAQFDHIGMITDQEKPDSRFVPATRVWVTDFTKHPFRIEWLRFEPDSPVSGPVRTQPHVAYRVDHIDALKEAARGLKELLAPFDAGPRTVGFYETPDGAVVELVVYK